MPTATTKRTVTLYSTPTCQFCKMTREFLAKHGVEYTDIDVTTDKAGLKRMIKKSGQMGVPVIDVDGELVVGFGETALREALGLPPA